MKHSVFRKTRGHIYQASLKGMFTFTPERIHMLMTGALTGIARSPLTLAALKKAWVVEDPALEQNIAGITFPRPLGLAAGFDKNATEVEAWGAIGFGSAEVGTITYLPQPGNPLPRLFRLPEDRAILNRMGFNNLGAISAAERLAHTRSSVPIGINLGKSKRTSAEQAAHDYRQATRYLGEYADYLVINVSSPNTPGLRDLQAVQALEPIIEAVRSESNKPLFVKIAPDLSNEDIDAVTDLALRLKLTGLIATNTTISREGLLSPDVPALGAGGISGAPLAQRSLGVLKRIYARVQDQQGELAIISVGGIETPQQAWERITHGANLLQGYTGLIYGGLDWIRDIHKGIAHQLKAHHLTSISDAVGSQLPYIDN